MTGAKLRLEEGVPIYVRKEIVKQLTEIHDILCYN